MDKRIFLALAASMGLTLAGPAPAWAGANDNPTMLATPVDCQRDCLKRLLDDTLNAMASHDIGGLPLANQVKSTQNGVALPLYDGIWKTVERVGRYRLDVIDPEGGQAGTFATLFEGGKPIYVALRLRVRDQKIDEIEILAARGSGVSGMRSPGEVMEEMGAPRAQFLNTVPPAKRMDRAELIRVADAYFANLQASTGKSSAPFAKSCNRLENGHQTTNLPTPRPGRESFDVLMLDCEHQQLSGFYPFVTTIRDRRFPVVDRQQGIVMSFGFFDHTGTTGDMHLTNGMTVPSPVRSPLTFQIAEIFQIDSGKIDQVEAVIDTSPYKMRNEIWKDGDR